MTGIPHHPDAAHTPENDVRVPCFPRCLVADEGARLCPVGLTVIGEAEPAIGHRPRDVLGLGCCRRREYGEADGVVVPGL